MEVKFYLGMQVTKTKIINTNTRDLPINVGDTKNDEQFYFPTIKITESEL